MATYPLQRIFEGGQYVNGATLNAQATAYADFILAPSISKLIKTTGTATVTIPPTIPVTVPWETPVLTRGDVSFSTVNKFATPSIVSYISATSAAFTFSSLTNLSPISIGDRITTSGFSNATYNVTNAIITNIVSSTITVVLSTAAFSNPYSGTFGILSSLASQYATINTTGLYRLSGRIDFPIGYVGNRQGDIVSTSGTTNTVHSRSKAAYADASYLQITPRIASLASGNVVKVQAFNLNAGVTNIFLVGASLQIDWIRQT